MLLLLVIVFVCFCKFIYTDLGFFFFFKQKTAYEMRISDWSSDVCSSDLSGTTSDVSRVRRLVEYHPRKTEEIIKQKKEVNIWQFMRPGAAMWTVEIGRASCRERVCQYV